MSQWNRSESLKLNPYIYGQLIFKKMPKAIPWPFQQKVPEQLDSHIQKCENDTHASYPINKFTQIHRDNCKS